ncbi:putative Divalent Anion:Na+ Symporter (DASS) Family Protein [Monocercomonoides exilis]|uniref:putative Divalent Anion:Na+ Symporter (DASS) Family Protein n=1 Tax=Monocercomonoides exilis TaxID=2049356 RepID=UPI00355A8E5A|nr:putative Divalent Anion:Na+ Symporter (DASS) Family Protein [Monocercomonoides exilis]|eukprot:MONOS_10481.1-p1 / transcript=MONOS_10481.1 / gene=MONOS_10481 / organism=Monocercomonoides_exilis_PA203 / gene_product=Divalent Anion:Na+ Symporter (DASS) Family Protein / transcript_product=Divalent Anion:Na+ Symporter (DASS) Family Protein / location=Mono_scaffold00478:34379-37379(+) / protein_length=908 / sequence_SO=supercontig / SO=protein_coding / is_pseudo=false
MKFSRQLQFIAVDRWKAHYINYKLLKKNIKTIFAPYINKRFLQSDQNDLSTSVPEVIQTHKPRKTTGISSAPPEAEEGMGDNTKFIPMVRVEPDSENVSPPILEGDEEVRSESLIDPSSSPTTLLHDEPEETEDNDAQMESILTTSSTSQSASSSDQAMPASSSFSVSMVSLHDCVAKWSALFEEEKNKVIAFCKEAMAAVFARVSEIKNRAAATAPTKGAVLELKRAFLDLSVDCTEIENFVVVNKEGFRKILKKLEKMVSVDDPATGSISSLVTDEKMQMEKEERAEFDALPTISAIVEQIQQLYVDTFSSVKYAGATNPKLLGQMSLEPDEKEKLQEELLFDIRSSTEAQVAWKKNTILGEYAAFRQRAQISTIQGKGELIDVRNRFLARGEEMGVRPMTPVDLAQTPGKGSATQMIGEEESEKTTSGSSTTGKAPSPAYFHVKYHWVIISFVVLIVMGVFPWKDNIAKQMRCLGLLIWASILWATDALPTHVTALFIPFLAQVMNVLQGDWKENATRLITSTISNTPYLAMGGYAIALAMTHTGLDLKIATAVLHFKIARKPVVFLIIVTVLQYLLTMFISNISSTVLIISLILPVLREIPVRGGFSKMLLLSIAMAGNVAGMATPLASPQSMVGLEAINKAMNDHSKIDFGKWTIGALPVTVVSTIVCVVFLRCFYKIDIKEVPFTPPSSHKWTIKQVVVAVVSVVTIVFWFIISYAPFLGNEAIVALIPLCIFFGFNLVPRTDITQLPWNMILLVLGGGALGESIKSSQLLQLISELFGPSFSTLNIYVQLLILTLVVAFISIFVSHTVAAIVLIPIVNSIIAGSQFHVELILMACALHVSPPMLLTVASFPNMCCYAVEDDNHQPYLTPGDYFKYGGTVTIVCYILINSIFYGTGLLMDL